jgi:translation initiation factor IF-3
MTNYRVKRKKSYTPYVQPTRFVINNYIKAKDVRLIDEEGSLIGVMSLTDAVTMAMDESKDVILINPNIDPPICRLMELSKHKYKLSKSEKSSESASDKTKTLRMSVRIAPHDLTMYANKAIDFLDKKSKVKIQIRMRGREKSHPEVAVETMTNVLRQISEEIYEFESNPSLQGDSMIAILKPKKK